MAKFRTMVFFLCLKARRREPPPARNGPKNIPIVEVQPAVSIEQDNTTQGVIFAFAQSRGGSSAPGWHKCLAEISDEGDYVLCTIRPEDGLTMDASKDYVYDVQVRKPGVDYPQVLTLLTGTITITDQVTSSLGTP